MPESLPGEPMKPEPLPLPVGMRVEEISERDVDALCEAGKTTPSVVRRLQDISENAENPSTPMTLAEFHAYLSTNVIAPEDFRPVVYYNRDGDCLEIFLSPESFVGEPIEQVAVGPDGRLMGGYAGGLTVYRGRESGAVVGLCVQGIGRLTNDGSQR